MRYALAVTDGVQLFSGSTPLPPGAIEPIPNWDDLIEIPFYYRKLVGKQVLEKTEAEKTDYDNAHPPTVEQLQYEAWLHLHYTDWYACRKEGAGTPIPAEIKDSRAAARELL